MANLMDTIRYLFASPTPEEVERWAYGLTSNIRTAFREPTIPKATALPVANATVPIGATAVPKQIPAQANATAPVRTTVPKQAPAQATTTAEGSPQELLRILETYVKPENLPTPKATETATPTTTAMPSPADTIDWGKLSELFRDKRATPAGIKLVLATIIDLLRTATAMQRYSPVEYMQKTFDSLLNVYSVLAREYANAIDKKTRLYYAHRLGTLGRILDEYGRHLGIPAGTFTATLPMGTEGAIPEGGEEEETGVRSRMLPIP